MLGNVASPPSAAAAPAPRALIGRVASISGAHAYLALVPTPSANEEEQATVGKFAGIVNGRSVIIGLISEVKEEFNQANTGERRSIARLELIGEIKSPAGGTTGFQRGINSYPKIGDSAVMMNEAELRVIYGGAANDRAPVGDLQQNKNIGVHINID